MVSSAAIHGSAGKRTERGSDLVVGAFVDVAGAVICTASSVAFGEPSRWVLRLISAIIAALTVKEKRTPLHNCA
ncbi:hypothetical protein JCM18882A_01960 [Brevibacterium metallidurans]|uniref:Uncharacterized protein n=1 Tax=Brevibacterium metallidurans TaxID=1482676 RepID=A0ABP3C4C7_9MICO